MLLCAFILICDEAGGALLFMLIITYCHILWCSISRYSSKSGIDVCLFKSVEKCVVLAQVRGEYQRMQTFKFVFSMILMKRLLRMTNRLSMVLQEKDAKILNAIIQIKVVKN